MFENLTPAGRMWVGVVFGMIGMLLLFIIYIGFITEWKFRCYQRLPTTGQSWSNKK
jgi:hypothetical protein